MNKHFKRAFTGLIALCMLWSLAACGGEGEGSGTGTTSGSGANSAPKESAPSAPADESAGAQKIYAYLKERIASAEEGNDAAWSGLADVGTFTIDVADPYGNLNFTKSLEEQGGTGLLSAMLQDTDGDGCLEFITVSLVYDDAIKTHFNDVFYSDSSYNANGSVTLKAPCLVLKTEVFKMADDGSVFCTTSADSNILMADSWGSVKAFVENVDGTYYVVSSSDSRNTLSDGLCMFTATGAGYSSIHFGLDYIAPFQYGKVDRSNYLSILGSNDLIDLSNTTITTAIADPGERMLCDVQVDYSYGSETATITVTDYTNLRQYLDDGGAGWVKTELPQGGVLEAPSDEEAETVIAQIADRIKEASGAELVLDNTLEWEDGTFSISYLTDKSNKVTIRWDSANSWLYKIELSSPDEKADDEWVAIKNAIVNLDELGANADAVAEFDGPLSGQPSDWNTHQGTAFGDYKYWMFSVFNATFRVERIQ